MEKQNIFCQLILHFTRCRLTLSALLGGVLLCGYAYGRLTPEDLAAISETGLTPLTAEQEDEYPARDYVIVETMRVSRGKTMKFTAGTRVFFHPEARIFVHGSLLFEGAAGNPVTIGRCTTPLPGLSAGKKLLFDSTSISVFRGAHLVMRHTVLEDPSIRVKFTDSTSTFELDNVVCSGNRFTFSDTAMLFPEHTVVTCSNAGASMPVPCIPSFPPAPSEPAPQRSSHPTINAKTPLRVFFGIGFLAAAATWYYLDQKTATAAANYHNAGTIADARRYYRENHRTALLRDCAAAGGGCFLCGFTVTFFIGGSRR